MPSHWDKKGEEFVVKRKFKELNTIGPVDVQVDFIRDFLVSYNTAEYDDSLMLGGGGDDEGDDEDEDEDEEEEDEDE